MGCLEELCAGVLHSAGDFEATAKKGRGTEAPAAVTSLLFLLFRLQFH